MLIKIGLEEEEFARLVIWLISKGNVWTTYFFAHPSESHNPPSLRVVRMLKSKMYRSPEQISKQAVELEVPDRITVKAVESMDHRASLTWKDDDHFEDFATWDTMPNKSFGGLNIDENPDRKMTYTITLNEPSPIIASMFSAIRGVAA